MPEQLPAINDRAQTVIMARLNRGDSESTRVAACILPQGKSSEEAAPCQRGYHQMNLVFLTAASLVFLGALLLTVLLLTPVRYRFTCGYRRSFFFRVRIAGGKFYHFSFEQRRGSGQLSLGLAGLTLWSGQPGKESKPRKREKKAKKQKRKNYHYPLPALYDIIYRDGLLADLLILARDLFIMVAPQGGALRGTVGFSDPELTGYLAALLPLLPRHDRFACRLVPAWTEPSCNCAGTIYGQVTPARLLARLLATIFSRRLYRAWKKLRRARKPKNTLWVFRPRPVRPRRGRGKELKKAANC